MKEYDYLIVGAGLFGAVFAHEATRRGKRCLVVERRGHIGGNCYTERVRDINVHKYGAHIFHTSNRKVWEYVNGLVEFNNFVNSPVANYKGELYNLPFNMNTFHQLWPDVVTPAQARVRIEEQKAEYAHIVQPANLEEQALVLGGRDIYEKLIKGYSEKQWGMPATSIPAFVIRRLPFRFTYDNNYFNDRWQGIPIGGYTLLFEKLLAGIEVRLNVDFLKEREALSALAGKIVYTGPIDAWFDYRFGNLDYRTVSFDTRLLEGVADYQGNAVFNYTEREVPWTRIIEHKHFEFGTQPDTVISKEYSKEWEPGDEPYYPVNDARNEALAARYKELAAAEEGVLFGGRLAEYKYYDMDKVIEQALKHFD
ncbi:MAG: UDP-galactopyranose mutase [Rikenellaceae bacterium]|nr:UDP-galactopyranose mutase [Rikenellaceae bacterium]